MHSIPENHKRIIHPLHHLQYLPITQPVLLLQLPQRKQPYINAIPTLFQSTKHAWRRTQRHHRKPSRLRHLPQFIRRMHRFVKWFYSHLLNPRFFFLLLFKSLLLSLVSGRQLALAVTHELELSKLGPKPVLPDRRPRFLTGAFCFMVVGLCRPW